MAPVLDESALPILTAVANPGVEAALVAAFGRQDLGVTVIRRCVDIVELLAAAAAGTARAALISADLRGLDRESIDLLSRGGLATVGLAADEADERLMHQLSVDLVVPMQATAEQVAGALRAAAATSSEVGSGAAGMAAGGPARPMTRRDETEPVSALPAAGALVAVWGPTGAPGRSTVALGLADALARQGVSTLLIDADPYGGSIATLTGLLDEAPGITAACRSANAGTLDVARLASCCAELAPDLRVLTGLPQSTRWPELKPAALEVVLGLGRQLAQAAVIDCGFCLEDDEELSYDTLAPRRNAATLTSLRSADQVVVVGSADPVGLSRLARELPRLASTLGGSLQELTAAGRVVVVANRLREGLVPGNAQRGVTEALATHAGVTSFAALPLDVAAIDAAHGRGQLISEAAPGSMFFAAVQLLAERLQAAGVGALIERKPIRRRRFGGHRRVERRAG